MTWLEDGPIKNSEEKNSGAAPLFWKAAPEFFVVRLAAHVSQGCKSQIHPVAGRI